MKKTLDMPCTGKEVCHDAIFSLLQTYQSWEGGSEAGRLWYFRPWRTASAPPKRSGVYAVYRYGRQYAGFAYFDTKTSLWLMAGSTVKGARDTAEAFQRDFKKNSSRAVGVYGSNYQKNQAWSNADLAGIDEMPWWNVSEGELSTNETAIKMCLLRQAMDPNLSRKQI